MGRLSKARYAARFADSAADITAAQRLRHRAFRGGLGEDADRFDEICRNVLIEEVKTGTLVACFRLLALGHGREIGASYSAQFYELSALESYEGRLVEMGRFCVDTAWKDPDILRVAWAAMTRYVDETGTDLLFGCSSFTGCEAKAYYDAFAVLRDRHLAPKRWLPKVKAPDVFRFARRLRRVPDPRAAMRTMPPLLKGYLAMGGWVSDHAVIDRDLGTLHVFTGLEVKSIPAARARLLRGALA
ncbi:GNAT family N-acetyltransferase [Ovoidimarina sediminis]|uniref:GNAT family N-acetyltransferase n=1 Tax=Ovoidimarina sediminis TaxID=3079856 RepID=UPI0029060490|nr:GNAT family N-acyltransferase [Rhodophyticola sp. MJ-SS7]MDU8946080.1 GNAT family N-acyltransferase [Rhodophyticola sp. MJ-SS7]